MVEFLRFLKMSIELRIFNWEKVDEIFPKVLVIGFNFVFRWNKRGRKLT